MVSCVDVVDGHCVELFIEVRVLDHHCVVLTQLLRSPLCHVCLVLGIVQCEVVLYELVLRMTAHTEPNGVDELRLIVHYWDDSGTLIAVVDQEGSGGGVGLEGAEVVVGEERIDGERHCRGVVAFEQQLGQMRARIVGAGQGLGHEEGVRDRRGGGQTQRAEDVIEDELLQGQDKEGVRESRRDCWWM